MYPNNDGWGAQQGGQPVQQQQSAEEPPDPDDLLGGSYRSAQFPNQQYGTTVGGRIIAKPKTTQQRDFQTKALKFYPDSGRPAWQVVVPVQAQPASEDDDGVRAFYLKGQIKQAVTEAVRKAGADRLEVGGTLAIRYVRDEVSRTGGMPQKIYEARYTTPGATTPAAQAPPAAAPPLTNHASSPVLQNLTKSGKGGFGDEPPF
jgi:hypothetical protein